jgi:hypothetical protein
MRSPFGQVLMLGPYLPETVQPTSRETALSVLLAIYMSIDSKVHEFRHLNGLLRNLVSWEELESWFERVDPTPIGVPSPLYKDSVRLPDEVTEALVFGEGIPDDRTIPLYVTGADLRRGGWHPLEIRFALPHDLRERVRPCWAASSLVHLHAVVEHLHRLTGWSEAQATVFAVSGEIPLTSQVTVEYAINQEYPALSRVVLAVDPRLSPREVADRFRQVRQELVGPRHRDITEKHLQLALFAILSATKAEPTERQGVPVGRERVQERMVRWNAEHPEWAYRDARNFSQDAGLATRRLLGQTLRRRQTSRAKTGL